MSRKGESTSLKCGHQVCELDHSEMNLKVQTGLKMASVFVEPKSLETR